MMTKTHPSTVAFLALIIVCNQVGNVEGEGSGTYLFKKNPLKQLLIINITKNLPYNRA